MPRKFLNGVDSNGQRGVNFADGVSATDAATYGQVLAAKQGFDLKDPVRVVSTSNITQSGLQTIDGVALAVNDRVLCAGQTGGVTNGVFLAQTGAWTRALDADENAEITPGFTVAVLQGTQKGTGAAQSNVVRWSLTNITAPTVGTTSLTFSPEGSSASSAPTSGSGAISVAGQAVSFVPKSGGGILQDGTGAYIDPTGSLVAKKFAGDVPAGSAVATVTHNLGTVDRLGEPLLTIKSTGEVVDGDIVLGLNSDTLTFPTAPTTGQYRYATSA